MTFKSKVRRAGWLLLVAVFAFGIVSAVRPQPTEAYGLISNRSVRLSSSVSNATNTAYQFTFTTVSPAYNLGSVVVKFCTNPIIGDACTAPTGLNTNFATLTANTQSGVTDLAINTGLSTANRVVLTRTPASVNATTISYTLGNGTTNGITNPTIAGNTTTFYARIMLFTANTHTTTNLDLNTYENTATDAGGAAMAVVNALNVTAKVQETLVFCVFTGANCAAGGNAIALGDSNNVLTDTATTYTQTANFDLASNALAGVVVRLKGDTLTSGAFTITPSGASCAPDPVTTSSELFGLRIVSYGAGQTFGGAAANDVDDWSCLANNHKFNPATTNTTYGQAFAKTIGATDRSTTNFELAAKAAGTTEAGIYTSTLQLIATATY